MSVLSVQPIVMAVKHAVVEVAHIVSSFAAAAAAAKAVDNNRQPAEADLRQLGLEGVTLRLNA